MKSNIVSLCFFLIISTLVGAHIDTTVLYEETTTESLQNEWITDPVVRAVSTGSSFNLTCQLAEHRTVVWQLNNEPLGFGDVLFQTKRNQRLSLSEVSGGSLLQVSDAQRDDSGMYKCQASDIQDLTHIISVLDEPPELNVTCRGKVGLLQWRVDRQNQIENEKPAEIQETHGSLRQILVQRSRRSSDEWETLQQVDGTNTQTKVKLLTRDQKYRVIWTDGLGVEWVSNESPDMPCTAPQDIPLSNPIDIQASITHEDDKFALLIYWTGIPEDHYMSEYIYYRIYYKEFKHDEWETIDIKNDGDKYFKNKIYISPETEECKYIIRIQAGNAIGLSEEAMTPVIVDFPLNNDSLSVASVLPTFTSRSQIITAKPGDSVTLKCGHEATRQYASAWYKNSSITPLAVMGYRMTDDIRYDPQERDLVITDLRHNDSATYVCHIQMNPIATLSHVLIVGDTIPVLKVSVLCWDEPIPTAMITVERCMGVVHTKQERVYDYDYYGRRTYYNSNKYRDVRECELFAGVEPHAMKTLEPYDSKIEVLTGQSHNEGGFDMTTNATNATVRLHPYNTYRFRASNRNIYGQSTFVEADEECETQQDRPWRNPSPVTITRTSESIVVLWKDLGDYEKHGSSFTYEITYSTSNTTWTHRTSKCHFEIHEIEENAVYTISVLSSNIVGDCVETPEKIISYPVTVQENMENCSPSIYPSDKPEARILAGLGQEIKLQCHKIANSSFIWRKLPERKLLVVEGMVLLNPHRLELEEDTGDLTVRDVQVQDYGYYECVSYQGNHMSSYTWDLVDQE